MNPVRIEWNQHLPLHRYPDSLCTVGDLGPEDYQGCANSTSVEEPSIVSIITESPSGSPHSVTSRGDSAAGTFTTSTIQGSGRTTGHMAIMGSCQARSLSEGATKLLMAIKVSLPITHSFASGKASVIKRGRIPFIAL